jgi:hypothetical protein
MYDHHIRDMAKLAHGKSLEDAEKALKEYWRDKAAFVWQVEDVLDRAKDMGKEITEDQALDVLSAMESDHDCCIGINWDVIDYHTDWVLEDA